MVAFSAAKEKIEKQEDTIQRGTTLYTNVKVNNQVLALWRVAVLVSSMTHQVLELSVTCLCLCRQADYEEAQAQCDELTEFNDALLQEKEELRHESEVKIQELHAEMEQQSELHLQKVNILLHIKHYNKSIFLTLFDWNVKLHVHVCCEDALNSLMTGKRVAQQCYARDMFQADLHLLAPGLQVAEINAELTLLTEQSMTASQEMERYVAIFCDLLTFHSRRQLC